MILLDTNIISEMMKAAPSVQVLKWMNQQKSVQLAISTITIAEIEYGINVLPDGKRRRYLEKAFSQTVNESFKHRIFSFDESAAVLYGKWMGKRKNSGRPASLLDGQIAAVALANKMTLATRNIRDFENSGLKLVNPFE